MVAGEDKRAVEESVARLLLRAEKEREEREREREKGKKKVDGRVSIVVCVDRFVLFCFLHLQTGRSPEPALSRSQFFSWEFQLERVCCVLECTHRLFFFSRYEPLPKRKEKDAEPKALLFYSLPYRYRLEQTGERGRRPWLVVTSLHLAF